MSEWDIRSIAISAPRRYKVYTIAKRNGGERLIAQPARELKVLQRALNTHILSALPVHNSAMAYRPGFSIRNNAEAHALNGPILKYDFKDFFPSIRDHDWVRYCGLCRLFEEPEDIHLSTQLMFYKQPNRPGLRLAIGAPSSPLLSNVLMFEFDKKISELINKDQITYTRYADDLTFSARRTGFLTVVDKYLRHAIVSTESPSLKINEEKTVSATRKYRRFVTGLVLTNDGQVSLGHERKKRIRAGVYRVQQGRATMSETRALAGMLAFANSVEPDFLIKLSIKYGTEVIDRIKRAPFLEK